MCCAATNHCAPTNKQQPERPDLLEPRDPGQDKDILRPAELWQERGLIRQRWRDNAHPPWLNWQHVRHHPYQRHPQPERNRSQDDAVEIAHAYTFETAGRQEQHESAAAAARRG